MAGNQVNSSVFRLIFYTSVSLMMMTSSQLAVGMLSENKYHVQIRVYVEPSAFDFWKGMTGKSTFEEYSAEINSYFVEVQRIYDSLEEFGPMTITFEVESLTLKKENVMNGQITDNIITSLEQFRNNIYFEWLAKPYDIAILFTGYNLGTKLGFANINKVCDMDGVGVIKQKTTGEMVTVLTHEIGHILGAEHDDGPNEGQSCFKLSGNVMNPKAHKFSSKRFSFSHCSYSDFYRLLAQTTEPRYKRRNCLKDGNSTVMGERLGNLVSPDDMCVRDKKGADFVRRSYYHEHSYRTMCQIVPCSTNNGRSYYSLPTLQGTSCGKNKVCNRGVCEVSYDGNPFVLDSCPLGDQPLIGERLDKTCADIDPSECPKYAAECCYTCNKTNPVFSMTGDDVCRELAGEKFVMLRTKSSYGDHLCSNILCSASDDGAKFDKKTFKAPDGMACGSNKRCSSGKCVTTSQGNPSIPDVCPFGDQDLQSLGYRGTCQKYSKDSCSSWGFMCCRSCQGK